MTTATDTFTRLTRTGQETALTAVRRWQDAVRAYAGATKTQEVRLPDVQAAVDVTFDLAERVLGDQREFTKALLSQGTQAYEAMTEQATHAAKASADAAKPSGDAAKAGADAAKPSGDARKATSA